MKNQRRKAQKRKIKNRKSAVERTLITTALLTTMKYTQRIIAELSTLINIQSVSSNKKKKVISKKRS